MTNTAIDDRLLERAKNGDLAALEQVLRAVQGTVYNLAVRMLGQREDAQDATQEVLLKITTHLASFRGESAFSTWVYRIASNHLLSARMRAKEAPTVSFDDFADKLEQGRAFAATLDGWDDARPLQPDEKLAARRMAITCTQAMLSCLDRPHRLAYVLAIVFGLEHDEAARVQEISPAAHRKRLSRARTALHDFMQRQCGLVSEAAPCRCTRQLPAAAEARRRGKLPLLLVTDSELDAAEQGLRELQHLGDAAAVMRGAPAYATPQAMVHGIRAVIERSALLRH
jgi:RNA polymerase sigma factor (sigma-70 family)